MKVTFWIEISLREIVVLMKSATKLSKVALEGGGGGEKWRGLSINLDITTD